MTDQRDKREKEAQKATSGMITSAAAKISTICMPLGPEGFIGSQSSSTMLLRRSFVPAIPLLSTVPERRLRARCCGLVDAGVGLVDAGRRR